jgi:hypothetical protein
MNTYKEEYLSPADQPTTTALANDPDTWDQYEPRLFRYMHNDYYYSNKIYSKLVRYAKTHRSTKGLYKYIRPIYNPVFRLVELHTSKAYAGTIDWELMSTGAIPFNKLDDAHRRAIKRLGKWSNISSIRTRYPRSCARYGDAVIKIVDEPIRGKVTFELLHPGLIAQADITPQGYFNRVVIAYFRQDTPTSPPWLYEEEITKDWFATYRNGEPWGEYQDMTGNVVTMWPNPYGFVPLVLARAIELDKDWGAALFFQTLDKIDQANDLASITYDQVRKAVNPLWWLEGVTSISQVSRAQPDENQDRDEIPMLLGPIGSRPTAMVANLNIADALNALGEQIEEIEKDHPELSLHRLRSGERVTGPGVLTSYDDAIQRIADFRASVDSGLLRAHQMALSIGGMRGYADFQAFDLESYDRGDLDFEIAERPVLGDTLTKGERLAIMQTSGAPKRWIWKELNKSESEIDEAEQEADERRADFQEALNQPSSNEDEPEEGNDGN